jgi:subtilisin family serine protease
VRRLISSLLFLVILLGSQSVFGQELYRLIVEVEPGTFILPEGQARAPWDSVVASGEVAALCDSIYVQIVEQLFPGAFGPPDLTGFYLLLFGLGDMFFDVPEIAEEFRALPCVFSASPDLSGEDDGKDPNDPLYVQGDQWYLNGVNGVDAPGGWEIAYNEGSLGAGTVIGIIERTGVDTGHIDLTGKFDEASDGTHSDGHGTWVAGVAAANTDNGEGIAGMGWDANILALRYGSWAKDMWASDVAQQIRKCVDEGVHCINISASFYIADTSTHLPFLEQACWYAYNNNVPIITSAGNAQHSIPWDAYPQLYGHVLSVGATDENKWRASFSNYGKQVGWLDVMAPGDNIETTTLWNGYRYVSGTSFACPIVSGIVALMYSKDIGYYLPADEVYSTIITYAEDMEGPGWDDKTGYGKVDAKATIEHTWVGVEDDRKKEEELKPIPQGFSLFQNSPNPFNPATEIAFNLPEGAKVTLSIYNVAGYRVAELVNGVFPAGYHTASWNALGVPSGIYFCRITAGGFTATRKMVLLK